MSSTRPRPVSGGNGFAANYNAATPFTNKAAQPDGFAHHPDGPEFLNSVHSQFTGTFGQIGCPPYAISGYGDTATRAGNPYGTSLAGKCTPGTMNTDGATSSLYASKFAQAVVTDLGVNSSTAGGCTSCHNVHEPLNNNVAGMSKSVEVGCVDCHSNAAATISPQVNLSTIRHPAGAGTPLAYGNEACNICHQPAGIKHIWRISTDANYSTYGDYNTSVTMAGGDPAKVNLPPTAADGAYTNAVWVDLDNACGQCHGGGVSQSNLTTSTTATISGAAWSVNVASTRGFASGKDVTIAGAGVGGADFKTIIAKVVRTAPTSTTDLSGTIYLTYATPVVASAASGAAVTVTGNPTHNAAPYFDKATLAGYAANMHLNNPTASFGWQVDPTGDYKVTLNGSSSTCPGSDTCTYSWSTGETGITASHTFPDSTPVAVTLTVSDTTTGGDSSITKTVTPQYMAATPTALTGVSVTPTGLSATANWTLAGGVAPYMVRVNWGDGTTDPVTQPLAGAGTLSHNYAAARTYTVSVYAIDSGVNGSNQTSATVTTSVTTVASSVTVSGLVSRLSGTPVSGASVSLKLNGVTKKLAYTDASGNYSIAGVASGTYTIVVAKSGVTFTNPAATITVAASPVVQNITATN